MERHMGTQGSGRKRSTKKERSTAEDDALNLIAREAEARLAAKRAARAEAREIRMKELERQQKEIFQVQKKYYGLNTRLDERADSKWGDIEQWMEDSEKYSRSSRMHMLSDDEERMSVGSRGSVGTSYAPSDLYGLNDLSSPRNPSVSFNGYQSSLYEDGLCSGSRRVSGSSSHPVEYSSYHSSRASSRASSARTSPVDHSVGSVASFLRSAVSSSVLSRDLDNVTIPDFTEVEDRDYQEKGPRAASALTAGTLNSLGGTSSRRGSGDTAFTVDAESSIREIKEIHELKDQIQDVETKYIQNLKEVKDGLAEVEEKYRKAMVSNAQLDNEKNNLMYQVDTLKDSLMELEELLSESRREYEEKVKEFERQKHAHSVLLFQFNEMKETLKQSEELLNEIRQLRMKQDGYVREISDLEETVEWKDKKIGALERQKEYTDAIRIERDELREEVVKLKDILKKHGIILGPDLNINGDVGESEVDGSPGAEPVSQSAQDSQTSPAEGNSVLGSTAEFRACREEEGNPEQQQETRGEDEENHLSPDAERHVAQTSCDEPPPEEHGTSLPTEVHDSEESHLDNQIPVDPTGSPASKAKAVIILSRDLQRIQTSEENVPQTETSEGGECNSHPSLMETETVGTTEGVAEESVPDGSNTEPQQEPEEAEKDEAEETPSQPQSQVSTASGKKKKKKRKGKKKGGTHENKDQQRAGTQKENGLTPEPDISGSTLMVSKLDQDNQEPDRVKSPEPNENLSLKGNLPEPNTDHGSDIDDNKKAMNMKMLEEADVLESTKSPRLTETRVELVDDTQNEEQTAQTEKLECEDPEKPTEGSSHVEFLKESVTRSETDEEDAEITSPDPESNLLTFKSKDDPDRGSTSSEGASTREDISGVRQSTTGHVLDDEQKTVNKEMLEQTDAVGSSETSCHTGTRLELSEDEHSEEKSPKSEKLESEEAAELPEGFLQDDPLKESVPQSIMAEDDCRATSEEEVNEFLCDLDPEPNLLSSKGKEDPNRQFASHEDNSTISGLQEPNTDPVSGDHDQDKTLNTEMLEEADAVESPETPDDSRVELDEVLQNQEETSEPEGTVSVLETTEGSSHAETIKGPDETQMGEEDAKLSSDSATSPDPEGSLLTCGKSEDPDKEFTLSADSSSQGDISGDKNIHTESKALDADEETSENIANNPDGEAETHVREDGQVPDEESTNGSEITEEKSASLSSNNDAEDQPMNPSASSSTNPSMKEPQIGPEEAAEPNNGEPRAEISEEICPDDDDDSQIKQDRLENEELNGEEGEPEDPPEPGSSAGRVDLTKAQTRETDSAAVLTQPPKQEEIQSSEEKEASPEHPELKDEINSSKCPLVQQRNESDKLNFEGRDSPPHVQLDSGEEEGEEDEGQSFDYDDMDMEAAIESVVSDKPEQEDVEEGADVSKKSSELSQRNTETNAEDGEEKVSEDDVNKADQLEKGPDLSPHNRLPCGDSTTVGVENVKQEESSALEEGLDAIEQPSDSQKTPEQTVGAKEVPQSGKDPKKKKGKGKSKEDCKMS
ncbi:protein P200 isoform X6 [Girardinichthys multiradiatus]|uniref:protein P200 isoform X6 n=1 Tax=Girardinichthys multiradiatus TaxID=208333 RepID=UPI001FACDFBF|nr:protein P200 isoform X6 [Girardinichthys multiradiatus]